VVDFWLDMGGRRLFASIAVPFLFEAEGQPLRGALPRTQRLPAAVRAREAQRRDVLLLGRGDQPVR